MTINNHLAKTNELKPIALAMRERQEQINREKRDVFGRIGTLVALASEQGADILLAKTKIDGAVSFHDWLHAHVPNLTLEEAGKFERISREQLTDPRQCVFAFLPAKVAEQIDEQPRVKPNQREVVWSKVHKLSSALTSIPAQHWTSDMIASARHELEPLAKRIWPDKF